MNLFIYGLTDPRTNAIRYIGQSGRGLLRPKAHKYIKNSDRSHRANWLRQLRMLDLEFGILVLEYCANPEDLNPTEKRWISLGRQFGDLTNSTEGGDSAPLSPETRAKLSAAMRGKQRSPETREKLSKAWLKRSPFSLEQLEKMSKAARGKTLPPRSPEWCENISASKKGVPKPPLSPQHRENLSRAVRAAWARRKSVTL